MPVLKLPTYWQAWMTFNFCNDQLLVLKAQRSSETASTFRIGGYVFRYADECLYFANSGIPEKYYIDTPLSEILALINEAIVSDHQ
ncbi:hypothetical protein [Pseudomonas yamanorum]|uniref:hypothetical protein n=1 Tax=Pseudomonas yamanorum TaxID=515393 RepID=UPI002ED6BDDF|nr:hypothetical protein VYI69_27215 [Pseudomonas yamanorum]